MSHTEISMVWELNIDGGIVIAGDAGPQCTAASRSFLCCSYRGGSGAVLWNRLMLYSVKTVLIY